MKPSVSSFVYYLIFTLTLWILLLLFYILENQGSRKLNDLPTKQKGMTRWDYSAVRLCCCGLCHLPTEWLSLQPAALASFVTVSGGLWELWPRGPSFLPHAAQTESQASPAQEWEVNATTWWAELYVSALPSCGAAGPGLEVSATKSS